MVPECRQRRYPDSGSGQHHHQVAPVNSIRRIDLLDDLDTQRRNCLRSHIGGSLLPSASSTDETRWNTTESIEHMRKYNPALKGMVDNHREAADEFNIPHSHFTDEELFKMIEDNLGATGDEGVYWFLQSLARKAKEVTLQVDVPHPASSSYDMRKPSDFVEYLEHTLIPDLKESGMLATAGDFSTAVVHIKKLISMENRLRSLTTKQ